MIFELNTDNQAQEILEGQRRYREQMATQYAVGRLDAQKEYQEKLDEKDKVIEEKDKKIEEKDKKLEEKDKTIEDLLKQIEELKNK